MSNFHKTIMGQVFYSKQVPELIKELRRIADALEKGNSLYTNSIKLEKKQFLKEKNKNSEKINFSQLKQDVVIQSDSDLEAVDE